MQLFKINLLTLFNGGVMFRSILFILITSLFLLINSCKEDDPTEIIIVNPEKPQVEIVSPVNGEIIVNWAIIKINATDDKGVIKVELFIDNSIAATFTVPPYEFVWSVPVVSNDSSLHRIYAKAYDADENVSSSQVIDIVSTALPPPLNLEMEHVSENSIRLSWESYTKLKSGYIIEKLNDSNNFEVIDSVLSQDTTAIVDGLDANNYYVFRVKEFYENKYTLPTNIVSIQTLKEPSLLFNIIPSDGLLKDGFYYPTRNRIAYFLDNSNQVHFADPATGEIVESISINENLIIESFKLNETGNLLGIYAKESTSNEVKFLIYDLTINQVIWSLNEGINSASFAIAFSKSKYFAYSSTDGNIGVKVYDLTDYSLKTTFNTPIQNIDFFGSDDKLFYARDRSIWELDIETGNVIGRRNLDSYTNNEMNSVLLDEQNNKVFISTNIGLIYWGYLDNNNLNLEYQEYLEISVPLTYVDDNTIIFPLNGHFVYRNLGNNNTTFSSIPIENTHYLNSSVNQDYSKLFLTKRNSIGIYEFQFKWVLIQ